MVSTGRSSRLGKLKLNQGFSQRLQRLFAREDFRRNPVRAVAIRLATKVAPYLGARKFRARLDGDLRIEAPYTSSPGKAIRYLGVSEPDTLATIRKLLVPGGVFVDVGAHIGEYALLGAKIMGPESSVYAFEPGQAIIPFLRKNVAGSPYANQITIFPVAVSNAEGSADFNQDLDPGHSRLTPGEGAQVSQSVKKSTVQVVQLDKVLASLDSAPHLVKIDVEGAEHQVIEGLTGLLEQGTSTRPAIVFEYLPRTWDVFGNDITNTISLLDGFGYSVFSVTGDSLTKVTTSEDADRATSGLDLDLVALLPEHIERAQFQHN